MKPKNPAHRLLTSAIMISACFVPRGHGAEISKLQNTNQLDNTASWSGGVLPGTSDVMLWNSTYTTPGAIATLAAIGSNLSVSGIKVTDVGGTRNAATTMVGYQNSGSAVLTIGAGGIDLSAANQAFHAGSRITIGASQTWNVSNANTNGSPTGSNNNEDLSIQAPATGAAFDFGGNTVTSTGAGQVTISSGYTLSNGVLNLSNPLFVIQGGSSRLTTINSSLSIGIGSGGYLRLQSNSAALTSAAPISVAGGGTLAMYTNNASNIVTQSGNVTLADGAAIAAGAQSTASNASVYSLLSGGVSTSGTVSWNNTGSLRAALDVTGAISGTGTINVQNTATNAETFTRWNGNNSGFTGTINVAGASGTRMLRLNSSNSGSATSTWNIAAGNTLQINGVSPQFGVLNGAGNITNSHASTAATISASSGSFSGVISNGTPVTNLTKTGSGTLTLSGANTYSGATNVNGGTLAVSSLTSGSSAVTIADGAAYRVNIATSGDDISLASLTSGSSTGNCVIGINNGGFSNPGFSPLFVAGAFNINAPTQIDLSGAGFTAATFPLIAYGTIGGTSGFSGLTLKLPPRVSGTLINNPGSVDVNITSVETIRWKGNIDSNWDADTVGDGSVGTPNWETSVTNSSTRYLQGAGGTDGAVFDDLASGTGDVQVNLTTNLTPVAITVNNATRDYLLSGSGSISGPCTLTKSGAADLNLSNSAANTYTGTTTISEGSITLGDGITAGAGTLGGAIDNSGELILNRPDDFTFSNVVTGSGKLTKNQANIVTIPNNPSMNGDLAVNGGKLTFSSGGTLYGVISGNGALECSGGTLNLNGSSSNTLSGNTTVSGTAILKLQKDAGMNAVSGDIYLTGSVTGGIQIVGNEQIADSADLYVQGTSTDPLGTFTGTETIDNVFLNTANGATGQLILKSIFNVTGTATVNSGILSLGSGSTISIGGIAITSPLNTIVRIAANTAGTTANIGSGGVTAAGGEWQVKYNGNNFDGIANLGGNVTTTGDFIITNGGYTGANLNVINLTGTRTFNIGAGTTTTVAPDFAGDPNLTADTEDSFTGGLIKAGDGKLVINASCNLGHTGATTVNAGKLILNGTAPNSAPAVAAGATLGGTGVITASTTMPSGAILAPGDGNAATLTFGNDITLSAGSIYAVDITGTSACDRITTATGTLTANGIIAVTLGSHTPVANETFDLADAAAITGTPTFDFTAAALPSGLVWDTSSFATNGTITVKQLGYESFVSVIANPSDRDPGDDPDGDGVNNLLEYVLGGNPTVSSQSNLPQSSLTGTDLVLTFSRRDDSEGDTTQQVVISTDLSDWSTVVPITPSGALPSGVTVNVVENAAADDTITVTIAKGANAAKFARLKVTK